MRALVGGVIGAAASAAVWLAAEHFMQTNLGWLVCLVGLATGYSVHRAATAGASAGFLRGALAIILTLAAIVGGRQAYAKIMEATSSPEGIAAADLIQADASDDADEDKADGGDAGPALPLPELDQDAIGLGKRSYSKTSMKKNLSEMDMLWMCIAALAAYVTGKGGNEPAPAEASEDGQEGSSDEGAEPQQDEPENKEGE